MHVLVDAVAILKGSIEQGGKIGMPPYLTMLLTSTSTLMDLELADGESRSAVC